MNLNSMIDNIEKSTSIRAEEGDYYVDGLLYCGKCKTKKQTRVIFLGKERTPYCLCKCAKERLDQEQAEQERQEFLRRVEFLRKMGFPESDMAEWNFSRDDRSNDKISTIAHKYVENFDKMKERGKGLLFYGTVGTGKTFIASCIANALIDKGVPCLVTNFARLTNTISGMYDGKQEYIDGLNRFRLLVIDDLASERNTEYMNEIVWNIIDARYRSGLPLIITTNLTADELKNPSEVSKQRIYSRLLEMTIPVHVEGKDRRKEKLKEDYKDLQELLGL